MSLSEYIELLRRVLSETYRVLVPGGRMAINLAGLGRRPYIPLPSYVMCHAMDLGFLPRGEIIWVKGKGKNGSSAWGSWMSASNPVLRDVHEYILVFSMDRFGSQTRRVSTISKEEFLASTLSVWEIPPENPKRVNHPAPFPVELPERLIKLYTFEGYIVLDPFMGSGTTAVAAKRYGRHFVGYETNSDYMSIAGQRLRDMK